MAVQKWQLQRFLYLAPRGHNSWTSLSDEQTNQFSNFRTSNSLDPAAEDGICYVFLCVLIRQLRAASTIISIKHSADQRLVIEYLLLLTQCSYAHTAACRVLLLRSEHYLVLLWHQRIASSLQPNNKRIAA